MKYATKEDLATWLGYMTETGDPDVSMLPGNVEKLLRDASRVMDHATMGQIDEKNERQMNVVKNATVAQCEYWIDGPGESVDIFGDIGSIQAGNVSIGMSGGVLGGKIPKLAPRARRELWLGGLLNRRVVNI